MQKHALILALAIPLAALFTTPASGFGKAWYTGPGTWMSLSQADYDAACTAGYNEDKEAALDLVRTGHLFRVDPGMRVFIVKEFMSGDVALRDPHDPSRRLFYTSMACLLDHKPTKAELADTPAP